MQLYLKKSRSSYDKKYSFRELNPEAIQHSSHVEQMILQRYNFSHRVKTNQCQKQKKHRSFNKTAFIPNSNVIAISQFPKIQHSNPANSRNSLHEKDQIKTKQKQNSIEIYDYAFVHPPPRKVSDYNDCIKRIQMNTTYRGFNSTKSKFYQKNRYSQIEKFEVQKPQDINKTPFKAAQRKMIIKYIIEKGFARKMEDSLMKARDEKKKVHNELMPTKKIKASYPVRAKRSVVFSKTDSVPTYSFQFSRNIDGKEHPIEPW